MSNSQASSKDYPAEFGDLICQETQNHASPLVVGILSVVVGAGIGLGMLYSGFPLLASCLLGFAIGGVGVTVAVFARLNGEVGVRIFSLFDQGVALEQGESMKTIGFAEVEKFRYERTSHYYNGIYSGDTIEIQFDKFVPGSENGLILFTTSTKVDQKVTFEFDRLIEMVSESISLKLAEDMAENGHVEWVDNVLISKDGINAPVRTLLSSSQQFIEWSEIKGFDTEEGKLRITIGDSKRPSVKIECKKTNFFPGYRLFCQLLDLHRQSSSSHSIKNELVLSQAE